MNPIRTETVYHGTIHKFDVFSPVACRNIFYFAYASLYAEKRALKRAGYFDEKNIENVLPAYLVTAEISYSNPFIAPRKKVTAAELMAAIGAPGQSYWDERGVWPSKGYFWGYLRWGQGLIVPILQDNGFDAIIMSEGDSFKSRPCHRVISVFGAKQITIRSVEEIVPSDASGYLLAA